MFGYATDETEEKMPLTVILAHRLNSRLAELRRNQTLAWLRPDSKSQVSKMPRAFDFFENLYLLRHLQANKLVLPNAHENLKEK